MNHKHTITSLLLLAGIVAIGVSCGGAPDTKTPPPAVSHESVVEESKPQTTCPVMGGEIDRSQYADHDGKRVYFCCPGCSGRFEADPEHYIEKLEKQGVKLEDVPIE